MDESIRLNKFLALKGICSRREADALIAAGRVLVNSTLPQAGDKVCDKDTVSLDGKIISDIKTPDKVVIAYNKPVGVVCSSVDQSGKGQDIISVIGYKERLFTIGRLDSDSEGLILLTNDGELSDKIMRASNRHEKEYEVTIDKNVTNEFVEKLQNGVKIVFSDDSEYVTRRCVAKKLSEKSFSIILTEGKNRQIRRMCEALNAKVAKLKRIRVLNIMLEGIKTGEYRSLTEEELKGLYGQLHT